MPKQAFPAAAEGMPRINRRAILGGIAAAPALVVPAAASSGTEGALDRVMRLAEELSQALVAVGANQFKAVIYPADHPRFPGKMDLQDANYSLSPEEYLKKHIVSAVAIMEEMAAARANVSWQIAAFGGRKERSRYIATLHDYNQTTRNRYGNLEPRSEHIVRYSP